MHAQIFGSSSWGQGWHGAAFFPLSPHTARAPDSSLLFQQQLLPICAHDQVTIKENAGICQDQKACLTTAGKAIKGYPRDKVIIKSLWGPDLSTGQFKMDISPEAVHKTIDAQLQRLGVDYLDLWVYRNIGKIEGWEDAIGAMSVSA